MYILHLDYYILNDLLFLQELARTLKVRGQKHGFILVHGSGERAERLLESNGHFLNEEQGLFIAETQEHRLLIERALLEQNQHIHNTLNEAGIACIRALGAQRGLLRRFSDGSIGAGRVDWLEASTSKAVYPIIASSIPSEHTSVEVAVTAATIALAKKTYASPSTIVFFSRKGRAGIYKDGTHLIASSINDVNSDEVHDLDALREVVQAGINVMLTSIKGLLGPNTIAGTRITA